MKILIAYSSQTGNTESIAKVIYEALFEKYDVKLVKLDTKTNADIMDEYDTVFIGCWIDRAIADNISKKFIKAAKNKNLAIFGTLGADPGSYHGEKSVKNLTKLADKSNKLLDVKLYNGKVDDKLIERLQNNPPKLLPKMILNKMLESSLKSHAPTEDDFKDAKERFLNLIIEEKNL